MDKRLFLCGIFIDLKKAFHTVNHGILLNKLEHYGFHGIINDWLTSYLSNRTRQQNSNVIFLTRLQLTVACSRAVLKPLLFLLYANDKQSVLLYLFADDTNILYADKDIKFLETLVNCELRKVLINLFMLFFDLTKSD